MSSRRDDWGTPKWLYDQLNEAFNFTLDVCAHEGNHKHKNYFNIEKDGLAQDWSGVCWMNPPYGRAIKHWIKKATEEAMKGATVVGLTTSRTDTLWFQDYATLGRIYYLKGRLTFEGAEDPAPFPSAIVVWYPGCSMRGSFYIPATPTGISQICMDHKYTARSMAR